jgi:hypothetical protein
MDVHEMGLKVAEVLLPVLMAALSWGAVLLANYIRAKVKNEYLKGVLVRLDDAVVAAVKEAQQVTVEAIKAASADGEITEAEQVEIKAKVCAVVKSHLGTKGLGELAKVLGLDDGSLSSLIGSKIEAAVYDLRSREALVTAANPQ